ncbi:MAG: hypothetical protein ACFB10_03960 [Salibacteraceae bacterium]
MTPASGQEKVLTAGFQFKPIVPTQLVNTGPSSTFDGNLQFGLEPRMAYSLGMVVRKGITRWFSFETGINYVTRNYNYSLLDAERNIDITNSLRLVGYEIPALGLVYVKLGEQIYMNGAFGLSFDMVPTDIGNGDTLFNGTAIRYAWLQTALLANTGWEYRSRDKGYFYFGFSYHRPFTPLAQMQYRYNTPTQEVVAATDLLGNYFTVDFRYFFHEDPLKKRKPKPKEKSRRQKIKEFEKMKKASEKSQ